MFGYSDRDVDEWVLCEGAALGATPVDIASRPEHLRKYTLVKGTIKSAPLDLAMRTEQLYTQLKREGWMVVPKSIGTDFGWFPLPKSQPIEIYLHREDMRYTPNDAQFALEQAMRVLNLEYSPIGAWAGEVTREVVVPTIQQAKEAVVTTATTTTRLVPWIAVGAAALVLLVYSPQIKMLLPKRRAT